MDLPQDKEERKREVYSHDYSALRQGVWSSERVLTYNSITGWHNESFVRLIRLICNLAWTLTQ
jgi:hypothetical protein